MRGPWTRHLQLLAEHSLHGHLSLHSHHQTRAPHPDAVGVNPWKTLIVLCLGFFMVLLDGVDVGPGQTQGTGVAGNGAGGLDQVAQVAHDVFVNGFVAAQRPTIGVAVAVVLAAAVSCLFLRSSARAER